MNKKYLILFFILFIPLVVNAWVVTLDTPPNIVLNTGNITLNITNNFTSVYNNITIYNITNNINITENSVQCTSGYYVWNVSIDSNGQLNKVCAEDQTGGGSGTVTQINTDDSLIGGPITTIGTLGINTTWLNMSIYNSFLLFLSNTLYGDNNYIYITTNSSVDIVNFNNSKLEYNYYTKQEVNSLMAVQAVMYFLNDSSSVVGYNVMSETGYNISHVLATRDYSSVSNGQLLIKFISENNTGYSNLNSGIISNHMDAYQLSGTKNLFLMYKFYYRNASGQDNFLCQTPQTNQLSNTNQHLILGCTIPFTSIDPVFDRLVTEIYVNVSGYGSNSNLRLQFDDNTIAGMSLPVQRKNSQVVNSVNGKTGTVVLNASDLDVIYTIHPFNLSDVGGSKDTPYILGSNGENVLNIINQDLSSPTFVLVDNSTPLKDFKIIKNDGNDNTFVGFTNDSYSTDNNIQRNPNFYNLRSYLVWADQRGRSLYIRGQNLTDGTGASWDLIKQVVMENNIFQGGFDISYGDSGIYRATLNPQTEYPLLTQGNDASSLHNHDSLYVPKRVYNLVLTGSEPGSTYDNPYNLGSNAENYLKIVSGVSPVFVTFNTGLTSDTYTIATNQVTYVNTDSIGSSSFTYDLSSVNFGDGWVIDADNVAEYNQPSTDIWNIYLPGLNNAFHQNEKIYGGWDSNVGFRSGNVLNNAQFSIIDSISQQTPVAGDSLIYNGAAWVKGQLPYRKVVYSFPYTVSSEDAGKLLRFDTTSPTDNVYVGSVLGQGKFIYFQADPVNGFTFNATPNGVKINNQDTLYIPPNTWGIMQEDGDDNEWIVLSNNKTVVYDYNNFDSLNILGNLTVNNINVNTLVSQAIDAPRGAGLLSWNDSNIMVNSDGSVNLSSVQAYCYDSGLTGIRSLRTIPAVTNQVLTDDWKVAGTHVYIDCQTNTFVFSYATEYGYRSSNGRYLRYMTLIRDGNQVHREPSYYLADKGATTSEQECLYKEYRVTEDTTLTMTVNSSWNIAHGQIDSYACDHFDSQVATTSSERLFQVYHNGSNDWQKFSANNPRINNTVFDNLSSFGISQYTPGYWMNCHMYEGIELSQHLYAQCVNQYATKTEAESANENIDKPILTSEHVNFLGRLICQQNDTTTCEFITTQDFQGTAPSSNDITKLTGSILGSGTNVLQGIIGGNGVFYDVSIMNDTNYINLKINNLTMSQINLSNHNLNTSNPTYNSLDDVYNLIWSAGITEGGVITKNSDGTINVSGGKAEIRANNNRSSILYSINLQGINNVNLPQGQSFVIYDYNGGSPQITTSTVLTGFNCVNKCIIAICGKDGTTINCKDATQQNIDTSSRVRRWIVETQNTFVFTRGTAVLSSIGLNVTLSAGKVWIEISSPVDNNSFSAFDTSVAGTGSQNVFTYYYMNGTGGWKNISNQKVLDTNHVDDGSGTLANITPSFYSKQCVYAILDDTNTSLAIMYDEDGGHVTLTDAEADECESILPPLIMGTGIYIGSFVLQKGASSPSKIFIWQTDTSGTGGSSAYHNALLGIDGDGTQHLSLTELQQLQNGVWNDTPLINTINSTVYQNNASLQSEISARSTAESNLQTNITALMSANTTLNSKINAVNTSSNLQKLGFNTTAQLPAYFINYSTGNATYLVISNYSVLNSKIDAINSSKANATDLNSLITNVSSIGNWSADKLSYATLVQLNNNYTLINNVNIALNNNWTYLNNLNITLTQNNISLQNEVSLRGSQDTSIIANITNVNETANLKALPGNCPSGQVVQNTTINGVQCTTITGGSGNVTRIGFNVSGVQTQLTLNNSDGTWTSATFVDQTGSGAFNNETSTLNSSQLYGYNLNLSGVFQIYNKAVGLNMTCLDDMLCSKGSISMYDLNNIEILKMNGLTGDIWTNSSINTTNITLRQGTISDGINTYTLTQLNSSTKVPGTDSEIAYRNSADGNIAGATYVKISNNYLLITNATEPNTPTTGVLLFAEDRGVTTYLAYKDQSGFDKYIQSHLGHGRIWKYYPAESSTATTAPLAFGFTPVAPVGTVGVGTYDGTSFRNSLSRNTFTNANNTELKPGVLKFMRGNSSAPYNSGGFELTMIYDVQGANGNVSGCFGIVNSITAYSYTSNCFIGALAVNGLFAGFNKTTTLAYYSSNSTTNSLTMLYNCSSDYAIGNITNFATNVFETTIFAKPNGRNISLYTKRLDNTSIAPCVYTFNASAVAYTINQTAPLGFRMWVGKSNISDLNSTTDTSNVVMGFNEVYMESDN